MARSDVSTNVAKWIEV